MSARALRREEAAGLAVAVAAHVALIAWLALAPPAPKPFPVPERMTVTIADDVAETSTSPDPTAESAQAVAPVLAPEPAPVAEARVEPAVRPAPAPQPQPAPQPAVRPAPAPRPAARPAPDPAPARAAPARPAPAKPSPAKQGGGSRIGNDFLKDLPNGQAPAARSTGQSAQAIGPADRAALSSAITRQLRPNWTTPQGAEADQLVTILTWDMNPDGSLAGSPRVISQSGITDANRAQAQRHAEQAIRAVRLAAPFDLPDALYPAWKRVASFRFDRKLSQ